jgi:hypothetical protein
VRRFLRSDVANIATNQETIWRSSNYTLTGGWGSQGLFICQGGITTGQIITFTPNYLKFFAREFNQITVAQTNFGGYLYINELDNKYSLFHCMDTNDTVTNWSKGPGLLIRPRKIT